MIKRGPPAKYPIRYPNSPVRYPNRLPVNVQRKPMPNFYEENFLKKTPQGNSHVKDNPNKNNKTTKLLAVIAAIFILLMIIFIVVKAVSKGDSDKKDDLDKFTADLKIYNVLVVNESSMSVVIENPSNITSLVSVLFVFYNYEGEKVNSRKVPIKDIEEAKFNVIFNLKGSSEISRIELIPIFIDESGKEVQGKVADEFFVEQEYQENETVVNESEELGCKLDLDCDDFNGCTMDTCNSGECDYGIISNCVSCGYDSHCDDLNACTANKCDKGRCIYIQTPGCIPCVNSNHCEDDDICTDNICMNGRCLFNSRTNCENITDEPLNPPIVIPNGTLECTSLNDCEDYDSCTRDSCTNNKCFYSDIKTCIYNDGCCPPGCNSLNDNDCSSVCGNNLLEEDELCDGMYLGGNDCSTLRGEGYTGTLLCSNCMFNASRCVAPCIDTCESLGYECGIRVICNEKVTCGDYNGGCPADYSCKYNGTCMKSCIPKTCAALGRNCGTVSDGCGDILTCGNYNGGCPTGYECSSNGVCVQNCVPSTCNSLGRNCGTVSDGCGDILTCGNYNGGCPTGYECSSNGVCVTSTPSTYCGDGACNGGETCSSCSGDCGSCQTYLRTFYVSSSDGNDDNLGTSPSSPWKTLSKVNSQTFKAGDAILFKRGDSWYGSLTVSSSGSSSAPITYGAYGSGEKPIISGFTTVSGWTSSGNGIYYKPVSTQSSPLIVIVNGANTPKGRWPNTGWLLFDSFSGNTAITDSDLNGRNFVNGEVVIRAERWITYRASISSHSGSTINFPWSLEYYSLNGGSGYFIQNDVDTFDIVGDWAYVNGNLYMYFGSNSPTNYAVKVSTLDSFAKLNNKEYITFDNLNLEGYNLQAIEVKNSRHITITNCKFQNLGGDGVYGPWDGDSSYMKVENCEFINNNNCGIKLYGDHEYAIIRYNNLKNIGMIDGLAGIKDSAAFGIHAHGPNTLISNNNLEYIGYNGISFMGENSKVINNFVNSFCQKKDDCGGIYTYDDSGSGKQILDNIIMNGINHNEGIDGYLPDGLHENVYHGDYHAHGIYIDGSDNVAIYRNTVSHNEGSGIFLNTQALGMNVQNNIAFDNIRGIQIISNIRGGGEITGLIMNNNIFIAKESNQRTLMYVTSSGDSAVRQLGIVNYNYYARPIDDSSTITTQISAWNGPTTYRTLAEWQSYSGLDSNSKKSPKTISSTNDLRFEYNPTSSIKTINLDGNYIDIKGISYSGSVILQPYSSVVLIKD